MAQVYLKLRAQMLNGTAKSVLTAEGTEAGGCQRFLAGYRKPWFKKRLSQSQLFDTAISTCFLQITVRLRQDMAKQIPGDYHCNRKYSNRIYWIIIKQRGKISLPNRFIENSFPSLPDNTCKEVKL